jgi:hypothetical protein
MSIGLNVRTAGWPTRLLSKPPCPKRRVPVHSLRYLSLGRDCYELGWAFMDQNPYPKNNGHVLILKSRPGAA